MTSRLTSSVRQPTRLGALVALSALLVAACGGGGDSTDSSSGFSIERALSEIPMAALDGLDTDTIFVSIADLQGVSNATGLERPTDTNDLDSTIEWFLELGPRQADGSPAPIHVPHFDLIGQDFVRDYDAYVAELGFGIAAIDTITELQAIPDRFTAVTGDVSFPDDLPEVAPGIRTIGDGADLEVDLTGERTPLRPLTRPLRVAERDGVAVAGLTTSSVEAWLADDAASLADSESLGSVAKQLDEIGVLTAVIHEQRGPSEFRVPVASTIGLGWNLDDVGSYGVIVYHFDTADDAAAHLESVTARFDATSHDSGVPIADRITLDTIETAGANVVAKVRFTDGTGPGTLYDDLVRAEPLFADR